MQIIPIPNHATLPDMPSATNSDHDGRYYTETESGNLFLKLDASNDPITAPLQISSASTPQLTITNTTGGDSLTISVNNPTATPTYSSSDGSAHQFSQTINVTGSVIATADLDISGIAQIDNTLTVGNVGESPDAQIYGKLTCQEHKTGATSLAAALDLINRTTADMTDGFGIGLFFRIQDNAEVLNAVAKIEGARDGADADGKLILNTFRDATKYSGLEIDHDQNVTIPNGDLRIGTPTDMLAPLNITGDTATIEDRHEGIWIRGKTGAYIVQINVRGSRLEIGGGASIDTEPAMSINYLTGKVGIGRTPNYRLDIDAGVIDNGNYDGLRIVDTGWKATSHPMLDFYNSHASFNGSLARIYGEIGESGENSKLYFAVADSSKSLQDRMVIDKDGNVGIGTTSPDTKLQVVGTSGFGDDSGNETLISATGDLSFAGTATVFNDLVLPLDSARVPASNAPSWEPFVGNLNAYAYEVGDFQEFTTEMIHGYKEGSDFSFHIHAALNATTGQEEKVRFEIEYSIADANVITGFGDVFPDGSGSLLTAELVVPNATNDLTHVFITVGVDSAGSFGIDATIKGRIRRIAKSVGGNELTGDIFVTQVGIHYEVDTVGSRTINVK